MRTKFWQVALSLLLLSLSQNPSLVNGYLDWDGIPEGTFVGPGVGKIRETDFCNVVRDKSIRLMDALRGSNLSVAVQYGPGFDFFQYDPEEPLSMGNPTGMIATMLDELGRRAGFAWRNSFVAYNTDTVNYLVGSGAGKWDRMLSWIISNFDLSVDKWILTTQRLENQTVFLHSWFDGSLILVDTGDVAELNWLGWGKPFDGYVWMAIAGTVLFSSIFMMFIETLEERRDGRSYKYWLGDQLFYSSLSISQHFQFPNPKTGAGRVFLASFAFWSMLVGATYTANLASLLVEDALAAPVNSIQSAMENDLRICIHEGSASQTIMESLIPKTKKYDKFVGTLTPAIMYENLKNGVCDILLGTRQEYEIFGSQQKYGCNLVQAGNELHSSSASFAIAFNPLNCDSVLAHVLNIHLNAIDVDGNMTKYWQTYLDNIDNTCTAEQDQKMGLVRRRMDETDGTIPMEAEANINLPPPVPPSRNRRRLASKASAAAGGATLSSSEGDEALTITGMAGIFMLHAVGSVLSIIMALFSRHHKLKKHRAAAMGKGKNFENNSFMESELNLKYLTMKRDINMQMNNMKLDMMTQMDNFFEAHRKSVPDLYNTASDAEMEQQQPLRHRTAKKEDVTNPDSEQKMMMMSNTGHTLTNGSVDTLEVLDDSKSNLFDL